MSRSIRTKPLKTTRTEAEVLAQCLDAAQAMGLDIERQNTGAGLNPKGRMVRFGSAGDSDLRGQVAIGLNRGRLVHVEVKREGFDPARLGGEKRDHFERQLAKLKKTNDQGGIAFWCDDSRDFVTIMMHVIGGARVDEPGYGRPVVYYPGPDAGPDAGRGGAS